jgi:triosephosphate isomerase
MFVNKGPFIINLKNYLEISGEKALLLTREAEKVSHDLGVRIIVSPPQVLLGWVSKSTTLEVVAQHVESNRSQYRFFDTRNGKRCRSNWFNN